MTYSSTQVRVITVSSVLLFLAVVAVALRLISRCFISRNAKLDDATIFVSLIIFAILNAFIFTEVRYGLGRHINELSGDDISIFLRSLWIATLAYNISLSLTKISVLLQYQRFLSSPRLRKVCVAMIFIVAIYGIVKVLNTIFMCLPVRSFWQPQLQRYCVDREALWLVHAGINVVIDIIILIIPIPELLYLKSSKKERFGVIFMFTVGGIVCLISFLRMGTIIKEGQSSDTTYGNVGTAIWSDAEGSLALVCASAPGVKPLFRYYFGTDPQQITSQPQPLELAIWIHEPPETIEPMDTTSARANDKKRATMILNPLMINLLDPWSRSP